LRTRNPKDSSTRRFKERDCAARLTSDIDNAL
jgi:hypothetical protein